MAHTKTIRTFLFAAARAIAPSAAYAVNVSANDGNGTQYRTASYGNGADVSGKLRATSSSVKSRVCTVRGFGLPDLCGSDSSTY